MRLMKKDGTSIFVESSGKAVRDSNGNIIGGVIVSRDITEIISLTDALKKSKQKFEEIFKNSPIAIEVFDSNGMILDFNPACARLFGVSSREVLGDFTIFMDPNISDEMKGRLKKGENISYEAEFDFSKVPYDSTEKGTKHLSVSINKMPEANGIGYVVQVVDITKQKETEARLEFALTEKDKVMSVIGHDLKNPIGAIIGYSSLLLSDYNDFPDREKLDFLSRINTSGEHMLNLLVNMLEYSRVQSGKYNVPFQKIMPYEKVEDELSRLTLQTAQKNINIINTIPPGLQVNANELMLGPIFQNLLTNAIKFSNKNGVITVSAEKRADGMVQIGVKDNGVGIDAARIPFLFKVCPEGMSTLGTEKEKGTGFGLPIVADMVGKQGGTVWVETKVANQDDPTSGSKFCFTLPAAQG